MLLRITLWSDNKHCIPSLGHPLGLPEGVKESVVKIGIVHGSLPSFKSCYGGKILRAAITQYKANRRYTGYNKLRD